MTMFFIQFVAFIGLLLLAYSYTKKKKVSILIYQIFSYVFYCIHYVLLNASSGFIISLTNLIKCLLLTFKEKYKWLENNFILFIFILVYILATYYTFQDIFSVLPGLGAIIYMSMEWQDSATVKEVRIGAIINSILWVVYNAHVRSYIGVLSDSSLIIINVVMLYKLVKEEKKKKRSMSIFR